MIVLRRVIPVLRCVISVLPAPRGMLVFSMGLMVLGLSMCSESSKVEGARPGSPEEAPAQTAGHKRMVELLSRIGDETEEGNPFTGVAEENVWREKLESLPDRPSARRLVLQAPMPQGAVAWPAATCTSATAAPERKQHVHTFMKV